MTKHSLRITSETVFAAFASHTVSMRALEIAACIGRKTEELKGLMPFIPVGAVFFIDTDAGDFPSRIMRVLPETPSSTRAVDKNLHHIASAMGLLVPEKRNRVVFLTKRFLTPSGELANPSALEQAIFNLCDYQPPRVRPKRDWKTEREARRRNRLEDEFGKPLWALPG